MTNSDASKGASDVVGARLRDLRKSRLLSVEDLGALCKEVGSPELTANAIYSIENGRRKGGVRTRHITVDELLGLACALDVSPLVLLLPSEPGEYPVTSGREVGSDRFFDWMIGLYNSPFRGDQLTGAQYPFGCPEWLVERQRKLDDELDADLEKQVSELTEVGERSRALLAEIEAKSVEVDAHLSQVKAMVDQATAALTETGDIERRVAGVIRKLIESVPEPPADQ